MSEKSFIIAGAGLTGLMAALMLTKIHPNKKIVIFEKSSSIGGKNQSIIYSNDEVFDFGMHLIYESCNTNVDNLYREILNEDEWYIYENNEKDIAGLFFQGKLQEYSHYVDLRSFDQVEINNFIKSVFCTLNKADNMIAKNALDFLCNKFGEYIVSKIHKPILKRMYGKELKDLDIFATKATALERIILFDTHIMMDLMKSSKIRSRLAFPDQINLPPVRENTQRALYPKKFGMINFVKRLQEKLEKSGVEIFTDTQVNKLEIENGKINKVFLGTQNSKNCDIAFEVENLLWTVGWPGLAKELEVDISDLSFERGPETFFLFLKFDRPVNMGRLYYFYCYDKNFSSFRITNYANYCPNAVIDGQYPLCIEIWPEKINRSKNDISEKECLEIVLNELKKFNIINNNFNITFSKMEKNAGQFPMPSITNTNSIKEIISRVSKLNIDNLINLGVMAEEGLFFLPDIMNDSFKKLKNL